ncbi:Gpr1 family protein [Coprinopsis cinerea AmutBmut pab1-1]|nr:Gpr1 family protein [Coprinopsis cinerea AmutBmut pab1-1]
MSDTKVELGNNGQQVQSEPPPPPPPAVPGNPTPGGMFAFAGTLFLMALYNLNAGGVTVPNVLVGMLIFAGGLTLMLVALLEYIRGYSLFATCFLTFSTFWLSYGAVLTPSFGILEAFSADPSQIGRAIGLYLFVYWITITMLLIGVIGKSKLFTILLSFASSGVLLLACAQYTGKNALNIVGTSFLLIVVAMAYYIGLAGLLMSEPNPVVNLPIF